MIKRFSCIFLSVLIIVSMTCMSFAETTVNTNIKINTSDNSYTLTVNAQNSDGNPLSYQWYECNANGENAVPISGSTGSSFTPSKSEETQYYYCVVTSTDADGNTESVNSKIAEVKDKSADDKSSVDEDSSKNNEPSNNESSNNKITINNSNSDSNKKEIYTFSVNNINEPVVGELPDTVGSSVGDGYSISSIIWDPSDHHFQPDTAYSVTVTIKLDDDVKASSNFKCLINNHAAVINGTPSNGVLSFSYTFSPTAKLDENGFPIDEDSSLKKNDNLTMSEVNDGNHLGIPGWLWFILLLIIIVSIGAVILSKKKKKKKQKAINNLNFKNNKTNPKEKNKISAISEKLSEIFKDDEDFDEDEISDDSHENKIQKLREIRAKEKSDIKEGKEFNKFDNYEEYEAQMKKEANNISGVESSAKKPKKENIINPKPKKDDNNITYFDSGSIDSFTVEGFTSPLSNESSKKEADDKKQDNDDKNQ